LRYVARFATTRAKLRSYLERKLRERGWKGAWPADLEAIADRFAELGLVDDAAYALARSRALSGRGYGKIRVVQALRGAGIEQADGEIALEHADEAAVESALRFAERRRLGPFARAKEPDPANLQKALAAMIRAGHSFPLARAIVHMDPVGPLDMQVLIERVKGSG
jgi:regulatory protein